MPISTYRLVIVLYPMYISISTSIACIYARMYFRMYVNTLAISVSLAIKRTSGRAWEHGRWAFHGVDARLVRKSSI